MNHGDGKVPLPAARDLTQAHGSTEALRSASVDLDTGCQRKRMRWRRRSNPARPCICLMILLVRVLKPSVRPLW